MSHERISPTDPQTALNTYLIAIPIIKTVTSEIPCVLPAQTLTNVGEPGSFIRYRELWRWVERLLRRAIILASRIYDLNHDGDETVSIWPLFEYYRSCSAHWPPTFRPLYWSSILHLNLRAFILRARSHHKQPRWISIARSIVQEYRLILVVSTCFPRAGERNIRVEDFVDLCVAVWEADGAIGEYAGWVIDVRMTSMSLLRTFLLIIC